MGFFRDLDRGVFYFFNVRIHQAWLDPIFWLITSSGLGQVQILLGSPLLFKKKYRPLFWQIVVAVLLGLLVHVPKRLIERDRPSNWSLALTAPDERIFGHSFPSGHTMTSFAVATVLAYYFVQIGKRSWALYPFLWAVLVAISRIYRGVHWPSDVVAGALFGIAAGLATVLLWNKFYSELQAD